MRVAWEHAGEPDGDDGGAPLAAELPAAADWAPWAGPHPVEFLALQRAIMGGGDAADVPMLFQWWRADRGCATSLANGGGA